MQLILHHVDFRFVANCVFWSHISAESYADIVNAMDSAARTGSASAIPRTWRILIYTLSILGFGNVAMCSWLSPKLRTASIVYHGFILLGYLFNVTIYSVKLRLSGPLNLMTGKLLYLAIVICGSSLCAASLWATLIKRPYACFQTWTECNIEQKKNNKQAFILFIAPLTIATLSITSCYYHGNLMLPNTPTLSNYFCPCPTVGTTVQQMVFWMAIINRELTLLASSLYSALACNIMIEFYVCATALHQELLTICKKQHLLQSELQVWRRKYACLEKALGSVNGYLGGPVFALLIMSVSTLILAIFQPIGEEHVEPGLLLPICNTIVFMTALTVPSAILNGKVSRHVDYSGYLKIV